MEVSDYEAALTPMNLVFQEQDKHHCCLDFKLLDEKETTKLSEENSIKSPTIK